MFFTSDLNKFTSQKASTIIFKENKLHPVKWAQNRGGCCPLPYLTTVSLILYLPPSLNVL